MLLRLFSFCAALALTLALAGAALAQPLPTRQWQRTFGRPTAYTVQEGISAGLHGQILVVGATGPYPSPRTTIPEARLWVRSAQGDSIRSFVLPRPSLDDCFPFVAAVYPTGDFLVSGYGRPHVYVATPPVRPYYHFLVRLDSLGNVRWRRTYNLGVATPTSPAASTKPPLLLPDGGALVLLPCDISPYGATYINWTPSVMRVDSTGAVRWQRFYGRNLCDLYDMVPLTDGSYALPGDQLVPVPGQRYVIADAWLLRITLDGDTLRNTYMGTNPDSEDWASAQPTAGGGLLLGGNVSPDPAARRSPDQGWLMQVDSLDRPQWSRRIVAPYVSTFSPTWGATIMQVEALAGGDALVLGGNLAGPPVNGVTLGAYLARWRPAASTAAPVWELQRDGSEGTSGFVLPSGSLTLGSNLDRTRASRVALTRYANVGQPYVPDYCRLPPFANLAYARPAPDSLVLDELCLSGPRYAQLVRYRWAWGDGTTTTRLAPRGGRVRHRYAAGQVPAPGTAVTLTVTNNLGCTHTAVVYPFGAPSATAQARALAAGASLFPNPATIAATLAVPGLPPGSAALPGEVLDAVGRVVQRFVAPVRAGTATALLDLATLPPGVYAVCLHTPLGTVAKRLVSSPEY